jgi:uncharacterized protein (DUF2237 family)
MALNVLGTELKSCSMEPVTGYFRDGCCHASAEDRGMHTLCAVMTEDFLAFTRLRGNDLPTPRPEFGFPGIKPGDRWCLCVARWKEAWEGGSAPPVVMEATHASVLEFLDMDCLQTHAADGG